MARKSEQEPTVVYGSGNVFADIGLPDAEGELAKAKLALAVRKTIESRGLTQADAAKSMGLDQPKVSKIVRGRLSEFSTEKLLRCLLRLGMDVDIVIHQPSSSEEREGLMNVQYA